jgi:hypothetical protein
MFSPKPEVKIRELEFRGQKSEVRREKRRGMC